MTELDSVKPDQISPPPSAAELRNLIDRIVRLEEERIESVSAIKDIYAEADSKGFSKKALRFAVKREMETADQRSTREQVESDLEIMLAALGDFISSPLGDSAVRRVRPQ